MGLNDSELLKKLLDTFKGEAEEHLHAISSGLIELEKASLPEEQAEKIEIVFREAHSLKGAARAVNLLKVEGVCQSMESMLARLKAQELVLSAELFDQLHHLFDTLRALLSAGNAQPPTSTSAIVAETAVVREEKPASPGTLRVAAASIDSLLRQAEEFIPIKAVAVERVTELREIRRAMDSWETEWRKVRPQAHALRSLCSREHRPHRENGHPPTSIGADPDWSKMVKLSAFLERNESTLLAVRNKLAVMTRRLESDRRALDRRVDDLVEGMTQVSMLPFSVLLEMFPKLVRDLCRDCGKQAELIVAGGEIETDRRILEEIKDPLIHLVRNCIDHGIETPAERAEKGKPPMATIRIAISPNGTDKVEIVVSDDGAGIDVRKVRAAAVASGLLSQQDAGRMNEGEASSLAFQSGISTSPMITEVSGRGLGLAIVREKAEKVGGTAAVESQPGVGTTFRIILPLTLARFRGILVRVGESVFVLPTRYVQRALRVPREEIGSAQNQETIQVDGRAVSAVRLRDVLEIPQASTGFDPQRKISVVLVAAGGEQIGFQVDEILQEQEVLVKSLGKQLPRVRNIAGATILGTGKVLPVLNVTDLIRSAAGMRAAPAQHQADDAPRSILVADDSITSRTLLKNILELAGYKVKTAFDGAEALSLLAGEHFDLVVSDVEMPRMSGLDLTARIRSDKKLSSLPVVLVTGLQSPSDQARGLDAGANAYIVKSGFDQGNLLEVVRRLI